MKQLLTTLVLALTLASSSLAFPLKSNTKTVDISKIRGAWDSWNWTWIGRNSQSNVATITTDGTTGIDLTNDTVNFKMSKNSPTGRVTFISTTSLTASSSGVVTWVVANTNIPPNGTYFTELWAYQTSTTNNARTLAQGTVSVVDSLYRPGDSTYPWPVYGELVNYTLLSTFNSYTSTLVSGDTNAAVIDATNRVAGVGYIRNNGSVPMTSDFDTGGNNITNVQRVRGPPIGLWLESILGPYILIETNRLSLSSVYGIFMDGNVDLNANTISNGMGEFTALTINGNTLLTNGFVNGVLGTNAGAGMVGWTVVGGSSSLFTGPGTTGSVTSTSADTNKFQRGDGTWALPVGSGDVLSTADNSYSAGTTQAMDIITANSIKVGGNTVLTNYTETDPFFVAWTNANVSSFAAWWLASTNALTAIGWGNHALSGYVTASVTNSVLTGIVINGTTASKTGQVAYATVTTGSGVTWPLNATGSSVTNLRSVSRLESPDAGNGIAFSDNGQTNIFSGVINDFQSALIYNADLDSGCTYAGSPIDIAYLHANVVTGLTASGGITMGGSGNSRTITGSAVVTTNSAAWNYALPSTNGCLISATGTITRITSLAYSGGYTGTLSYRYWTNLPANVTALYSMPITTTPMQSNVTLNITAVPGWLLLNVPTGDTNNMNLGVEIRQ